VLAEPEQRLPLQEQPAEPLRGAALFTPNPDYEPSPPPWTTPLTVQLGARNGACFEATFSAAGVRANGTTTFSAKSD
jgi:hypothetical protein